MLCFAGVKRGGGALLGGGVLDSQICDTLLSSWSSILSSFYILLTYVL